MPTRSAPHLQPLPVAQHEAGCGCAAGPSPQLVGKAKGRLRRQVGVDGEQVAAFPHLLLRRHELEGARVMQMMSSCRTGCKGSQVCIWSKQHTWQHLRICAMAGHGGQQQQHGWAQNPMSGPGPLTRRMRARRRPSTAYTADRPSELVATCTQEGGCMHGACCYVAHLPKQLAFK